MSDVPAGWYTDPRGTRLERYYDGTDWTEKVRGTGAVRAVAVRQPVVVAPPTAPVAPVAPQPVNPYGGSVYAPPRADHGQRTADGQRLAGWWARAAAAIIDEVIQLPIAVVIALPFLRHLFDVYRDLYDGLVASSRFGTPLPDFAASEARAGGDLVAFVVITLVVGLVYHVGFLSWRQATPGKLALGLRVRRLDRPGPMPVETIVLRWFGQFGPGALKLLPFVSITLLVVVYVALDRLWALWNGNKMTIHDRLARTIVVVHERAEAAVPTA